MTRNVMVDLETLGQTPGCSIVAIGAVACSDDGWITDTLYVVVSRSSCASYGLFEEQRTLDWWDRQSPEAREVLALADRDGDAAALPDALDALNAFVRRQGSKVLVWGNGSDFDNAILAVAAHAAQIELAWPFWANACYRTLKRRAPQVAIKRSGTHHNALDDARSQAEHLGRINRALALTGDTIVEVNAFLTHMAERFRERTTIRVLCFRIHSLSREHAMHLALGTFDAAIDTIRVPFGHPSMTWDRDTAHAFVDEELQHWEG